MKPHSILAYLLLFLGDASIFAAAPDSVAGLVFREYLPFPVARAYFERTIILREDGTYSYLVYGRTQGTGARQDDPIFLGINTSELPAPDGQYTYVRTGESSGRLELLDGNGASFPPGSNPSNVPVLDLTFTSATSGTVRLPLSLISDGTFTLSNPAATRMFTPVQNASLRGQVTPGHPLIAGLYVPGTEVRQFLIRVSGPGLTQFGVPGVWADPDFEIYAGPVRVARTSVHYGDWTVAPANQGGFIGDKAMIPVFQRVFASLGEFPFEVGSKDAAEIVRLPPGAYTVVANPPPGDPGGEALIEIYPLP